jgi:quercetin dioxygenase-like cupin family protein
MMHLPQWCALLAVGLFATACKREAADGGGPLPPVDSSLQARDSIQHPFDEIAPGVFSRVVYRTPPSAGPGVEVRDIELAQGKAIAPLTFPGAVVIEVRSGKGSLRLASKSQEVQAGGTFGLSQGDSLQLANKEAGPLSLRVYVIGSR